jgi:hypothetical protein
MDIISFEASQVDNGIISFTGYLQFCLHPLAFKRKKEKDAFLVLSNSWSDSLFTNPQGVFVAVSW